MMFALRQMMPLTLMMFPSEMMTASPDILGKHRIIANEMSNIIFAKQMHHIAIGDASLQILTLIKSWGYFICCPFFGQIM